MPPWSIAAATALVVLALVLALAWRAQRRRARRWQAAAARAHEQLAARQAELNAAFDAMRELRLRGEAADLAKTRFVAAASHDLRQPVHALGLYLAALGGERLEPPAAEVVERMRDALAALESMLAALLDVSRIDAGQVQPQWQVVALAPLVQRVAAGSAAAAESRGLRLAVRIADDAAATVSDPVLLERIVANLLANAVKYTDRGGVLLACRRRGEAWRIEVWDTGPGIPEAQRERIFEEFVQASPGAHGLGLGLAIVQRLSRLLGLSVRLFSRPGRGSVFVVEGLAAAGAAPLAAEAARQDWGAGGAAPFAGRRVVLLEDDTVARDATARLLRRWGLEVTDAAAAAVLSPATAAPDALVADLHLADGRAGPAEAEALYAAWGRRVPLLVLSADRAAAAALRAAGTEVLDKPVAPAQLRQWLQQAFGGEASAGPPPGEAGVADRVDRVDPADRMDRADASAASAPADRAAVER